MKAPIVDSRKFEDLMKQMKEMVPYFTPEWKFSPNNPDVGTALFMVVALQLQETIDLFNQSFDKNFISFLNYLNINLKPPKPAKVPLVFGLSEGTTHSVPLKKETRVFGKNDELGQLVSFETGQLMDIVPSKLVKVFYASGKKDQIIEVEEPTEPFVFFEDASNLQEHAMYLSNEAVLIGSAPMTFEIKFDYYSGEDGPPLDGLSNEDNLRWLYYGAGEWHKFDEVKVEEHGLILKKTKDIPLENSTFQEMRWIKCMLKEEKIKSFKDFFVDGIFIKSQLLEEGIIPQRLYYDDKPLNEEACYPFGEFFNQQDTFYIGSEDVFSKKGAQIEISFDLELVPNKLSNTEQEIDWKLVMKKSEVNKLKESIVSIHTVKWYYWNGTIWENLKVDKKYERIFYHLNEKPHQKVSFPCPEDIVPFELNGEAIYSIKLVIDRIENYFKPEGKFMSPKISHMRLNFDYEEPVRIENFIIYNNLDYQDLSNPLNSLGFIIKPFKEIGHDENVIYFSFDRPLENGPVHLLFLIDKINNTFVYNKKIKFEYLAREKEGVIWKNAKVIDETEGLTQDGIINFSGLKDFEKKKLFDHEGYWIRLVFEKEDEILRYMRGIYLNGVFATQQLSIYEEFIDMSNEQEEVYLAEAPILDAEIWVNEIESLGQKEIQEILESKEEEYRATFDEVGIIKELWIKWKNVNSLEDHGAKRVYQLDLLTGKLNFREDIYSKIPSFNLKTSIYADYKVGGGSLGNMQVGAVNQLEESIAFIDHVFNPDKGYGGANAEILPEAVKRGVSAIRHRNRAVTAKDLEDLVKEVSTDIYKVKCIENASNQLGEEKGALHLVILMKDKILTGMSYTLKKEIEDYLEDKIPYHLSKSNKLYVSDPELIQVDLKVLLTMKEDYDEVIIRNHSKKIIEKFLDYKTGNYDHSGWDIGEIPMELTFYGILSEQEGVLNIESITMNLYKVNKISKEEISLEIARKMKNTVIVNGNHQIKMNRI
ncbi:MAG: baseplate J/gp47 family protein [Marinisporobacter sp.]|jgi:hypothetical protein|nr:baseplate J/gp47 family protein [Marinisporobacter sp.]